MLRRPRVALTIASVLILGVLVYLNSNDGSPAAMETAAQRFLEGLSPQQRQKAAFAFNSDERTTWHFTSTVNFPRNGLRLGEMSEPQRALAHALLRAGLSGHGYMTVTAIIELEGILRDLEAPGQSTRDPEFYFFSVFGNPSRQGVWGWRVEGHHVSLHFTIVDGTLVTSTPTFLGANPAEVRDGPRKGLRVLGAQEDLAHALVVSLDPAQRAKALIDARPPNDIFTMNLPRVDPLASSGLLAAEMTGAQRDTLMKLVETYASYVASDQAAERLARVNGAGVEKIAFAWMGETGVGTRHYYRLQGPTFLVEYYAGSGNHVHSVWREFNGDFGRDLLREHLAAVAH